MVRRFLEALAEVALAVAGRELEARRQEGGGQDGEPGQGQPKG